jgi:hypothetical protein
MNVLFLDVAGVLDTLNATSHRDYDAKAVHLLRNFVQRHNFRIVLTSNLRIGKSVQELNRHFEPHGLTIFDKTPAIPYGTRGDEIAEWLDNADVKYEPVQKIVILDDDNDMGSLSNYLIQTSYTEGINESIIQQCERGI